MAYYRTEIIVFNIFFSYSFISPINYDRFKRRIFVIIQRSFLFQKFEASVHLCIHGNIKNVESNLLSNM